MSQSLFTSFDAPIIEDFQQIATPPGPREYAMVRENETVRQEEIWKDSNNEVVFECAQELRFTVGSGQRGRTYLKESNGYLYQAPLGWYTTSKKWDLSPGYDAMQHARFNRSVGDGCLYCHAGRVNHSDIPGKYNEPIFLEHAIGCERCHGPGKQHIEYHHGLGKLSDVNSPNATDSIVNPGKLGVIERESVCNQCHLQGQHIIRRYGRSFWDFRPGDRLDDTLLILLRSDAENQDANARVVSQVEQMRASICYIASDQELGCTSCHDPHRSPSPDQRHQFYIDKCKKCHESRDCTLPMPEQQAAPSLGSCVHCHMPKLAETNVPHTAQTDHRIQIPGRLYQPAERPKNNNAKIHWRLIDDADSTVPTWEIRRAFGIAAATQASARNSTTLALQAIEYLLPEGVTWNSVSPPSLLLSLGEDSLAIESLAASLKIIGQQNSAVDCWKRLLEIRPTNAIALSELANHYLDSGQLSECDLLLSQLISQFPDLVQWRLLKLKLELSSGQIYKAIQTAEIALEIDPTLLDTRKWLRDTYIRVDQAEKAEIQTAIINRMTDQ